MDANDQGWRTGADAAPPAERRVGGDRRTSGRRRADRSLADLAPDPPAGPDAPAGLVDAGVSGTEPAGSKAARSAPAGREAASGEAAGSAPAGAKPAIARKYHFRSFDDRRLGIDRRTPPGADDERLSADEVASLLRQQGLLRKEE